MTRSAPVAARGVVAAVAAAAVFVAGLTAAERRALAREAKAAPPPQPIAGGAEPSQGSALLPADPPANLSAQQPPQPAAGAMIALAALAAGGFMFADDTRPDRQRDGMYIASAGLAVAPWLAHAGLPRSRRALFLGLATLAASVGTVLTIRLNDPFDPGSGNPDRIPFGVLFSSAVLLSAAGIVDGFVGASLSSPQP